MWIVGMMGSGKSSAGRLAADKLGVTFYDTDNLAEEKMGSPIPEFWDREGEAAFREIEKMSTKGLFAEPGIKATGGGVVLDSENRQVLANGEAVVWLKASVETLVSRLAKQEEGRPLLSDDERSAVETLNSMLGARENLYEDVSTHVIDTDGLDVSAVADRIIAIWQS